MALLSKGVEVKIGELDLSQFVTELPELSNGERETVEVTTLNDDVRKYINGILGGAETVEFEMLYDNTTFMALVALEEANKNNNKATIKFTEDNLKFAFDCGVAVVYGATAINESRKMTVRLTVASKIEITTEG